MSAPPLLEVALELELARLGLQVEFQAAGPVTGVFGVSGAGKTTLLQAIAGLRPAARGVVRFAGECWQDSASGRFVPPERRGVGYVPQDSLLFPHLDVRGNLAAGRARALRAGNDFAAVLERAVAVLELETLLGRPVQALSGGERQRVALGRALCSGPALLLLDEPLASLDVALRHRVLPYLRRVQAEFALPMLLVSHDPVEVQALCDELVVLSGGRVVAQGEPGAVLTRPDVFPLAQHEGFRNLLPARVVESGPQTCRVALGDGTGGTLLTVPRTETPVGGRLLVGIRADDITLALERPHGVSARNAVPAVVERVTDGGSFQLVAARVDPSAPPLVAEVTADAVGELGLSAGCDVFLLLKTSAIQVYEEAG